MGAQIRETVDSLHDVGVIWGDGKPDNILIHDKIDDAWVIDFGGGYTKGMGGPGITGNSGR